MLLLQDRLERLDVGGGGDRQGIGHPPRQRHDAVQLRPALENDKRSSAAGLIGLEEGFHVAQVLGKTEALLPRQAFNVRFAGFERLVPEAVEDTDEDGWVGTDEPLRREVEIKGDYRALIVLARDSLQVLAADEGTLGEDRRKRLALGDLFGGAGARGRRPGPPAPPLSLVDRLPGGCHPCSFRS